MQNNTSISGCYHTLAYCKACDTVFCVKCNMEWKPTRHMHLTTETWSTVVSPVNTTGTWSNLTGTTITETNASHSCGGSHGRK